MHVSLPCAVFWAFASVLVLAALYAILARQTVHAVLSLMVVFFAAAALWLLLQAEFLGLILLYVYVGAVMTLFLFVVMMLYLAPSQQRAWLRYAPLGALMVVAVAVLMVVALDTVDVLPKATFAAQAGPVPSNTLALGRLLYTKYVLVFQLTGVLLLSGIVAAVTLLHRKTRRSLHQDPQTQIGVDPASRMRVITMPPERDA